MSEFTAITTQEQLDAVIGDRLKRCDEKWQKKYEGYLSPEDYAAKTSELEGKITTSTKAYEELNKKASQYEKDIAERDSRIKKYEINSIKHKVAHENGLSYDAVDFIQGEDEESIKASAEKFKSLVGKTHNAPGFNNEPNIGNDAKASMKKLAQNLSKKGD